MNVTIIISRLTCLLFLSAPSLMSMDITHYVMSYCFGTTTNNTFYNELQNKFASLKKDDYSCKNIVEYLKPESGLTAFCRRNLEITRIGSNTIETQTLAKLTPEKWISTDYKKNLIVSCENKKLIIECENDESRTEFLKICNLERSMYYSASQDLDELKDWINMRHNALLMVTSMRSRINIIKFLLQQRETINYNKDSGTALFADDAFHYPSIEELLKHANINHQDENGMTALMYASKRGYYSMVKFYIENGADVSLKDNQGKTALDWTDQHVIVRLLKQREEEMKN